MVRGPCFYEHMYLVGSLVGTTIGQHGQSGCHPKAASSKVHRPKLLAVAFESKRYALKGGKYKVGMSC